MIKQILLYPFKLLWRLIRLVLVIVYVLIVVVPSVILLIPLTVITYILTGWPLVRTLDKYGELVGRLMDNSIARFLGMEE